MPLARGQRLGTYEVLGPLGAGGMGEVWRARDGKLSREVALKVLPDHLSDDPKALARFESEAKAVAALSHPHILSIHDFGRIGGVSFAVMELLEGETLRGHLQRGALPLRKALELASQVSDALAAAHEKGIVHRDVKPENVFVTKEGRAKLLDFGLARRDGAWRGEADTRSPTVAEGTAPGTVLGTVAYMSPEQAQGLPADHRSDQFSLGVVLYEALTGKRAFVAPTAAETLTAILRSEPEPVERHAPATPAPVRWILDRLLAKDPAERYESTRDLARELETCRVHLSEATTGAAAAGTKPRARRVLVLALSAVTAALVLAGAFLAGRSTARSPRPTFRQLTFGKGRVGEARFTPDGNGFVYSAEWEDRARQLFSARLDAPEVAIPLQPAEGLPVGTSGSRVALLLPEAAPSSATALAHPINNGGVLATAPYGGGLPRPLQDGVLAADWSPDGGSFAIVRASDGRTRLEFPPGRVLFETAGWIQALRVSPRGDRVAFAHWPMTADIGGDVLVASADARVVALSEGWAALGSVGWSPDGREVWFSAGRTWGWLTLRAVSLEGKVRDLLEAPQRLTLCDVRRDGRVLVASGTLTNEILGRGPGDVEERSWSWLDASGARGVSSDGRSLLIRECGVGGGPGLSAWLRRLDGGAPVLLGSGETFGLSPDGKWAVTRRPDAARDLLVVPTGPGEPRRLPRGKIETYHWASFFPDNDRILVLGNETGRPVRLFLQDLAGSPPRPVSPEGIRVPAPSSAVSPDGMRIAAISGKEGEGPVLVSLEDGTVRPIDGLRPDDVPLSWTSDGRSLFVREAPVGKTWPVARFDLRTGRKSLWRELRSPEPAGAWVVYDPVVAKDGEVYFYTVYRNLSNLYLVEGLR